MGNGEWGFQVAWPPTRNIIFFIKKMKKKGILKYTISLLELQMRLEHKLGNDIAERIILEFTSLNDADRNSFFQENRVCSNRPRALYVSYLSFWEHLDTLASPTGFG